MKTYKERKEAARQKAIEWQSTFEEHNYSWDELVEWNAYFEALGKRYGLTDEFRENGII